MAAAEDWLEQRRALKRAHPAAFARLAALLFEEDPIGLDYEENTDEYEPEATSILPRLPACTSATQVRDVVHAEFVHWFDAYIAGPPERYARLGARVWSEVVPLLVPGADRPRLA